MALALAAELKPVLADRIASRQTGWAKGSSSASLGGQSAAPQGPRETSKCYCRERGFLQTEVWSGFGNAFRL
jgi:hypothetical protein